MVVELITFTSPCSHNASMESKRLRRFDLMPGNVQNAAPATVFPLSLCKSFVHERAYPLIENEYKNGESQRSVLSTNSRPRWRHAHRLTPTALVVLRNFFDARNGSTEPFYFYDPYDTTPNFSYYPTRRA